MTIRSMILWVIVIMSGCEKPQELICDAVAEEDSAEERAEVLFEHQDFRIDISDVFVIEDKGGYATGNRFSCNVCANRSCELWLEVCDSKDGHQYSEIKDENTRRRVDFVSESTNAAYTAWIVIDGDGESVESVVKLWCRPIQTGDAFVLLQTNAVFGTWIGR